MDSVLSHALQESATSPHERENHPHGVQTVERQSRTKSTGFAPGYRHTVGSQTRILDGPLSAQAWYGVRGRSTTC